ncbi:MAG: tRNA (N6-isopentenyl adenosine(37)-C2)-methylthiotransferase MiaB [Deltaproteobacteria bacterium]|nr:tRNA (N6-isopentenyl adenosine(37)-C2)-methylthiotransferase MiaB [Deltaproteobacteria bacterium]
MNPGGSFAGERPARRFRIRTYGCQMNAHDTEKIANLLHHAGLRPAPVEEEADLLVVNTCSVREKAAHRLHTDLGLLRAWKQAAPGRIVGVGGCVAQQEGDALLARFPHVDFVFGTHNLRLVPAMVEAAARGHRESRTEETRSQERFDLPERHPEFVAASPGRAFVTVMEGCDMFCSFCIVPLTRGREISRPAAAVIEEVERLAAKGVREITLLGQTVNAYGRHDAARGHADTAGTVPFAALVHRVAQVSGVARIRYTSPHPLFFGDDLIEAHGALEALCPHVHLPLQSGSDAVLARMRRRYRAADYLGIVARLRAVRPDIAITTDLIVGFPGETDADFEATLDVVRAARFVDAYTFKYSPRPGTAAANAADGVAPGLAQERLEALQDLMRGLTLEAHRARVGAETDVLIEGESRRGKQPSGRDPWHRVVNLAAPAFGDVAAGQIVRVRIVEATPHSLIAELAGHA